MKIHDCRQGSPEWWSFRAGVPTASNFEKIVTPKKMTLSAQGAGYIRELIEERIVGAEWIDRPTTRPMQHGIDLEPEARAFYEVMTDADVDRVGFITTDDGRFGCSPDALVGEDGGLELKCPQVRTHIGYLLEGGLPAEYRLQVHGSLWVTGRSWWDFVSYSMGLPPLVVRVERDQTTKTLGALLEKWWPSYQEAWETISALRERDDPGDRVEVREADEPLFMA
jgi:hypothetical protein